MNETEVAIIGAGIAGVSVAYHLSCLGHKVLLLERDVIAAHASGLNSGAISVTVQPTGHKLEASLAEGSLEIFRAMQLDHNFNIEFRQSGALRAIQTQEESDLAWQMADHSSSGRVPVQVLSIREARSIEPELNPHLLGALFFPTNAQANPVKAARALMSAAEQYGAQLLTQCEVSRVGRRVDGGYEISAGGMTFVATKLVIAAGPWTSGVGKLLGLTIPIVPVRGQMWSTESLPPRLHHNLSAMESSLQWHLTRSHADMPPYLTHRAGRRLTRHLYGRQTRAGEIIFGGDRELCGFDVTIDPNGIDANYCHATEILPFLSGLDLKRRWAGLMPFSMDGRPIIGPVPEEPSLCIIGGLASSGFGEAPMAGKLLAEWMHSGQRPDTLADADPTGRVCITA